MVEQYLHVMPKVEYLPDYDPVPDTGWDGVRTLWYEGAKYKEHATKVFAYIGYPEMKTGKKVPTIVLVHGGGGIAAPIWIRKITAVFFQYRKNCFIVTRQHGVAKKC